MAAGLRIGAALSGWVLLSAMTQPAAGPAPIPPPLGDPPPISDTQFDAAFVCPETLADDKARRKGLVEFFHWAQARHPDWSLADTVEYKKTLLIHHQCEASLRDLADYAKREYR